MKTIFIVFIFALLNQIAFGQVTPVNPDPTDTTHTDGALLSGYYLIVDQSAIKRKDEKTGEILKLFPTPVLTVKNITSMEIAGKEIDMYVGPSRLDGHNPVLYKLKFNFDSEGKCAWAIAIVYDTDSYRRIAFILNDKIIQIQKFDIKTEACIQGTAWDVKDELEIIKKKIESEKSN